MSEDRDRILSSAVNLFGRYGFHGTSTRGIAEAAGTSQAYVVRAFNSKAELFCRALDADMDRTIFSSSPIEVSTLLTQALLMTEWVHLQDQLRPALTAVATEISTSPMNSLSKEERLAAVLFAPTIAAWLNDA